MHTISHPRSETTSRIDPHTDRGNGMNALLRPSSIALIGASNRAGAPGRVMVDQARAGGFTGRLFPVNPRETEISGLTCVPNLAHIASHVDLAVIAVGEARTEAALSEVIDRGIPAAMIFAGCDGAGAEGDGVLARLTAMAREAGLALCGPNSMGFVNPSHGLNVMAYAPRVALRRGNIALIAQSGSAFSALTYNHDRLGFSLAVSTGREIATRSEDYLHWALDQPETGVIGLFQETARDPERFREALERAEACGIPVVILKVGRSEVAARFAASHSGAIAGNAAAYEAVFRAHNVIETHTLDDFAACLQMFSHVDPLALPDGRLAGVHDSGGEREMVVDRAEELDVPYAVLSAHTKARLADNLDAGLHPENPLDAWGSGKDFEPKINNMMNALITDPDVGVLGLFVDIRDGSWTSGTCVDALASASAASGKPGVVVSNFSGVNHAVMASDAIAAGLPVIEGTDEGLRAVRALFDWRDARRHANSPDPLPQIPPGIAAKWRIRLTEAAPLDEAEALSLLADYGIPTPRLARITSPADIEAAVATVGLPLVLKTAAPGVAHKSDVNGVIVGLQTADDVRAAYADLSARLGPMAIVAEMAPKGAELAFGILHDDSFGPLVMLATGGIWIELLKDRVVALPPFGPAGARRMIDRLRLGAMLTGARGRPPADLDAVADALARLSRLASDLGDLIAEMDVNPVLAGPGGCCAVDALLTPRTPAP